MNDNFNDKQKLFDSYNNKSSDNNIKNDNNNNSCDVLIKNASVVNPDMGIVHTNIMIENGKIKKLNSSFENINSSKIIDARDRFVIPGVIDPHVHYGVYTSIDKAGESESCSAAIGGVTTLMRMLRLQTSYSQDIKKQIDESSKNHFVDFTYHPSILYPYQISDIVSLKNDYHINSFKIYMNLGLDLNHIHMDLNPYSSEIVTGYVNMDYNFANEIIKSVSLYSNSTILVHAEDIEICSKTRQQLIISENINHKNDLINNHHHNNNNNNNNNNSNKNNDNKTIDIDSLKKKEAKTMDKINNNNNTNNPLELWSKSRPPESEVTCIKRISDSARKYNTNLYFVHIGSNQALEAILDEKEKGLCNIYIETCPHYLTHYTEDYSDLKGKVVPPIRNKSDTQSLWYAIKNGIIDTIGTDHVANRLDMKIGKNNDLWTSLSGFPGVATMLPILLHEGINKNRINLIRLVELTSYNTSRIFGMYPVKGTIQEGSDADLVILDLDLEKTITPEILHSYSDYTIYDGWKVKGWPVMTMVRGEVIMEDGKIDYSMRGHGKFVSRY